MSPKMVDFDPGDVLPSAFVDALQEYISSGAFNLKLEKVGGTSLRVPGGIGDDQVGVAIDGLWRYNAADATAAHPGGGAGEYDVWVTTGENDDPIEDTNFAFGLSIKPSGYTWTGGDPPHQRKVGTVTWDGAAITDVRQTVGSAGLAKHHADHEPGGPDSLDWYKVARTINLIGTLSARPSAVPANEGFWYTATDVEDGTIYRSNGSTWVQVTKKLFASAITPTTLAGDTNDWAPSGLATGIVVRVSTSGTYLLTGMQSPSSGAIVALLNVGTSYVTLAYEHTGSSAANRFATPYYRDLRLRPGDSAIVRYDPVTSRWTVLSASSQAPDTGWIPVTTQGLAFVSADAPVYVMDVPLDRTGEIGQKTRVRVIQGGVAKYFIVLAAALTGGGNTRLTMLSSMTANAPDNGGLSGISITEFAYSGLAAPAGLPADPQRWTVQLRDATPRTVGSGGIWGGHSSLVLDVPIGVWNFEWSMSVAAGSAVSVPGPEAAISTSATAVTDTDMHAVGMGAIYASSQSGEFNYHFDGATSFYTWTGRKVLSLSAKTTYRVIGRLFSSGEAIPVSIGYTSPEYGGATTHGYNVPTILRAVCALL